VIKILPSKFDFLKYYIYFSDKSDLASKVYIKAYDNKLDVVLFTEDSILLKTLENVEVISEFHFLADLHKFSGLMKSKPRDVEVELIPGLISIGKKSKSEFEIYPNKFPNYREKIKYELESEGIKTTFITNEEIINKTLDISSRVKPEEDLKLVFLNRNYLITTDRYTTVLCENPDQYFEEVYGLPPKILKAFGTYYQNKKEKEKVEDVYIDYKLNENENKIVLHYEIEGILTIFYPSYHLNMIDIFTLTPFSESIDETDYITVDVDFLINAISSISLSSSFNGVILDYKDTELIVKAVDNQSIETIDIKENTLRLNNYNMTFSATELKSILEAIKRKGKAIDKNNPVDVRIFDGGNNSILTRFEAVNYDEFKYFRSKVRSNT
jgi:hypothetical protein